MRDTLTEHHPSRESWILVALAWTAVGTPLAWAVFQTLKTAVKLFVG